MDGEDPASYSNLLLATQKLEIQAEARNSLPQKVAMTKGSNTMHSQTPGSLFLLHKLKGNHTFATQSVTIGNDAVEGDPGVEQEGEKGQSLQLMRKWKHLSEWKRLISPSLILLG